MSQSATVILKSDNAGNRIYAVSTVDDINPILDENVDAVEKFLSKATLIYSSLEKAMVMADLEEELFSDDRGERTELGVYSHSLVKLKFHPFLALVSAR